MFLADRYLTWLRNTILPKIGEEGGAFLFGSVLRHDRFRDVDIAHWCRNPSTQQCASLLQEELEESTFPYFVDIVDIDESSAYFYDHLSTTEKVWISKPKNLPPQRMLSKL